MDDEEELLRLQVCKMVMDMCTRTMLRRLTELFATIA